MTSPLEQPQSPIPTLAEFNDAVRANDDWLVHRQAMLMLEDHFDTSLANNPELWTPQHGGSYLLRQRYAQEDGEPAVLASTTEVSDRNPYARRYKVHSYDTDGLSSTVTAEWGKGSDKIMLMQYAGTTACGTSCSTMPHELVESTVRRAHPELTEIIPPTGFRAFWRYMFYRGTRTLYAARSARFPGATGSYPE